MPLDMECFVKTYRIEKDLMVAACDKDVLGKTFTEGKLIIEIKEEFYGRELKELSDLKELLLKATIANLTGKNAVACGIEGGFIDPVAVITIKGVPHAQMVRL